jgi:6-phosphogluconolactonase
VSEASEAAREIRTFPDGHSLAKGAADLFADSSRTAVGNRGVARVALSGGSTPGAMYDALVGTAEEPAIPWAHLQVFFSDERFVAPETEESNYHLASSRLLAKVPIPVRSVHPVATVGVTVEESASMYEDSIRRVFEVDPGPPPAFDLIFLGLGPDGHTASLFPGTAALREKDRLVVPNFVPRLDAWRITFTYPLINAARTVVFLVQGQEKAQRVAEVLSGREDLPATHVRPNKLVWLLDGAAASQLQEPARNHAGR